MTEASDKQKKTVENDSLAPKCPDFAEIVKDTNSDDSLFDQIANCFSVRLEEFATYYCRDHALGQDAFQEAMITALRSLDGYRGDSPIEPWLRRIVVTSCYRLRRGKKNDPTVTSSLEAGGGAGAFADDAPNQEVSLMMAQSLELLRLEMDGLEEPNRTLLIKHDIHEVQIARLSEEYDMTEEAVKSRLKRARSTIRQRILGYQ